MSLLLHLSSLLLRIAMLSGTELHRTVRTEFTPYESLLRENKMGSMMKTSSSLTLNSASPCTDSS